MDNDFKKIEKGVKTGFKWFGALWIFSFIASLAVGGAVLYVIYHFVSKFW
jgi:hypothetical protein